MTVKKKSTRQKKVLQMIDMKKKPIIGGDHLQYEKAIRRQMELVKKDYERLIADVAGSVGLIRDWVGFQATIRSESLKSRFIRNS